MQFIINLERIASKKRAGKYVRGGDYVKKCNQLNEKGHLQLGKASTLS